MKIRDEELERMENEKTAEKKVTFTQGYKKNEERTMDQNNAPEAKISKEETRRFLTIDLGEVSLLLIKTSLQGPTLHMKTITRTIEDHMITPKSAIQKTLWKSTSKWIFQQLEWKLAEQWNFSSFPIDSKKKFPTK